MPHCNAYVGGLKRGAVINAVAGHSDNFPGTLKSLNYLKLMGGTYAGKNMDTLGKRSHDIRFYIRKVGRIEDFKLFSIAQIQLVSDGIGCRSLVSGYHNCFYAGLVEDADQFPDSLS